MINATEWFKEGRSKTRNYDESVAFLREIQINAAQCFGEDLLVWMQKETKKHEHACITGDCPHSSQIECYLKLVEDCWAETQRVSEPANAPLQASGADDARKTK